MPPCPRPPHTPSQLYALTKLRTGVRGLFLPYGYGKSRPALEHAIERSQRWSSEPSAIFLFCPPRLINNWIEQIQLWCPSDTRIVRYEKQKWLNIAPQEVFKTSIGIIPYTRIRNSADIAFLSSISRVVMALCDESRAFANHKSQTGRAMRAISMAQLSTPFVVISGNPCPESDLELWNQYAVAYKTRNPFGKKFWSFRSKYFQQTEHDWVPISVGPAKDEREKIKRSFGVWWTERNQDMPTENYFIRRYEPSQHQIELTKQLLTNWRLVLGDLRIECNSGGAVAQKVRQLLSGFVYVEDIDGRQHALRLMDPLHTPKYIAATQLVDELLQRHEQLIIWRYYREEDAALQALAQQATPDHDVAVGLSEEAVTQFFEKSARILIAPVGSGEGLNALVNATADVFFSSTYSADRRVQAERRIARLNQSAHTVEHWDLAAAHTVEQDIVRALQRKTLTPARLQALVTQFGYRHYNQG